MMHHRRIALGALIVAVYLGIQMLGLRCMGLTDDDDYYIPAGISYSGWLGRALTGKAQAFSWAEIDQAFQINHEHPPVAKYALGICARVFVALGPIDSARMATVLFSTLIAALLMALALTHVDGYRGLWMGGLAVFFLIGLPRFYFHSHAATLDVPVAATYLLAASLVVWGERSHIAALWAGPAFGLALATKLNAPFLLLAFAAFILLTRRFSPARGPGLRLPRLPWALVSMLIFGPVFFVLLWPWLWSHTWERFLDYIAFHLHHYGIYFLYFGRIYDQAPFAPWHAPLVMAAITTPLATLVLAGLGVRCAWPSIWARLCCPTLIDNDPPNRREADLILWSILNALVALAVVAGSGGPKYGGEKLFMPFYPFLCLVAGFGGMCGLTWSWKSRYKIYGVGVLGLACLSTLALEIKFGSYALSSYNGLVSGLRGATAQGFERQYYDVAFLDLVAWLNVHAPAHARIHFLPNNWEYVRTYNWYRKAGVLRADIEVTPDEGQAQWIVLTHERRFARYGSDRMRYRQAPILLEKRIDGTPIWSVLEARVSGK